MNAIVRAEIGGPARSKGPSLSWLGNELARARRIIATSPSRELRSLEPTLERMMGRAADSRPVVRGYDREL